MNNATSPSGETMDKNPEKKLLILGGILVVTAFVYLPSLRNGFTDFDDDRYVMENPHIRSLSKDSLKTLTTKNFVGNYHPLTMISYAIEYRFWKLAPFGYHMTNFMLHLGNTALVFVLFSMLGQTVFIAGITSLLFGVHPLHVESVASIAQRKDVLYGLFYLGALISYVRYSFSPDIRRYLLTFGLFLLAVLSKGMAVIFPLLLFLIDYFRNRKPAILEKIPFIAASALFTVVGIRAQESNSFITGSLAYYFSWAERLALVGYSLVQYFWKLLVPLKLSAFYPYPVMPDQPFPGRFWFCLLVIPILLFLVFLSIKRIRNVGFGLLFFLLNIVLVLKFVPLADAFMADRYTYISSLGVFFIFAVAISGISSKSGRLSKMVGPAVVIYFSWLGAATFVRCKVWESPYTLWSDVTREYPESPLAWNNLGRWKYRNGDLPGALADYNKAIDLEPRYPLPYNNRGVIKQDLGQIPEALQDFNAAIALDRNQALAYYNRGNIYFDKGALDKAIKDYDRAIDINPNYADAFYNSGIAKIKLGKKSDGCRDVITSYRMGFPKAAQVVEAHCQ